MPEADGGLQERVDHGPDVLLDKWPGPLRPHPQIQATADVGTIKPAELLLISVFTNDCTLSAVMSRKEICLCVGVLNIPGMAAFAFLPPPPRNL